MLMGKIYAEFIQTSKSVMNWKVSFTQKQICRQTDWQRRKVDSISKDKFTQDRNPS